MAGLVIPTTTFDDGEWGPFTARHGTPAIVSGEARIPAKTDFQHAATALLNWAADGGKEAVVEVASLPTGASTMQAQVQARISSNLLYGFQVINGATLQVQRVAGAGTFANVAQLAYVDADHGIMRIRVSGPDIVLETTTRAAWAAYLSAGTAPPWTVHFREAYQIDMTAAALRLMAYDSAGGAGVFAVGAVNRAYVAPAPAGQVYGLAWTRTGGTVGVVEAYWQPPV